MSKWVKYQSLIGGNLSGDRYMEDNYGVFMTPLYVWLCNVRDDHLKTLQKLLF